VERKFVPLGKQSKRKRREHYAAHRKDWGGLNPVTRKPPDPKAYSRKKTGQWCKDDPLSGFLYFREAIFAASMSGISVPDSFFDLLYAAVYEGGDYRSAAHTHVV